MVASQPDPALEIKREKIRAVLDKVRKVWREMPAASTDDATRQMVLDFVGGLEAKVADGDEAYLDAAIHSILAGEALSAVISPEEMASLAFGVVEDEAKKGGGPDGR